MGLGPEEETPGQTAGVRVDIPPLSALSSTTFQENQLLVGPSP